MFLEDIPSKNMHDTTADEADETLSLSDLPLYSNPSFEAWEDDLFGESQGSSSISSSENDPFEFFSQEMSPPTSSFPPENIIFCGKLIPYRNPNASSEHVSSEQVESKKLQTSIKKKRGWGVLGWRFGTCRSSKREVQSKNGEKSTTTLMHKDDHQQQLKKRYNSKKHGKGCGLPLHKMPMLTSTSSGKARWHLLLFGMSRISSEVKLRDIKSRQSHRHSPPSSPVSLLQNHRVEKVCCGVTNRGSGMWGLIRVLSCGGNHHPTTMAVGSISRRQLQ